MMIASKSLKAPFAISPVVIVLTFMSGSNCMDAMASQIHVCAPPLPWNTPTRTLFPTPLLHALSPTKHMTMIKIVFRSIIVYVSL